MDRPPPDGPGAMPALTALATELATLKRLRDAASPESLASRLFRRAWAALLDGEAPDRVALATTADALAALRLGAMDAAVLARLGVPAADVPSVLAAAFDQVAGPVEPALRTALRAALGTPIPPAAELPALLAALVHQPRAGATCPGRPRIVLEPPEGHGDHCLAVAVLGVVLAGHYGAPPGPVFLAGLAHHLHNATMPDSGFAGEMLLGAHLAPVMAGLFAAAIATLPPALGAAVRDTLEPIGAADTPAGRAFNAADVIDRVVEMRHFAAVAGFTTQQALGEMELVHAGPLQAFHHVVMREAGLLDGLLAPIP